MPYKSLPHMFFDRVSEHPERLAHAARSRDDNGWSEYTWNDYAAAVRTVGAALIGSGVSPGDRIAILASNRPEWVHLDMAAMTVGAVPLGIYTTSSAEQIEYILGHSGVRMLVVEDESQYDKIAPRLGSLAHVGSIVKMPGTEPRSPAITSWEEFTDPERVATSRSVDERRRALRPDDLGSLVYTSGTTGPPKAVMLTHRNLVTTAEMGGQAIAERNPYDCAISYLPLAHVAERGVSLLGPVAAGYAVYFCADLAHLPDYMREVRPTVFVGVPRLWEKMHDTIHERLRRARSPMSRLAAWALASAGATGKDDGLRRFVRKTMIAPSLRKKLGLDRAHTTISGSAPISPHLIEFFAGVGIEIREVYGLSECGGPATFSRSGRVRPGWVGEAFDGVELRLEQDGEIMIRGANVFPGYLDDATATAATLRDGWLCSGDIGELDDSGRLRITGRKKEMIITAGGKNIAPRHIEGMLSEHELVRDVMLVGDGRKYLTALFTLTRTGLEHIAEDHESDSRAPEIEDWAIEALESHVARVNESLARAEQIKRFCVLRNPFTEATGELTPTRKMRRSFVCQKYATVIDELYATGDDRHTGFVATAGDTRRQEEQI